MLTGHVGGTLVGNVGDDHALDLDGGHIGADAVLIECEALGILVLQQVLGNGGRGIDKVRSRGLGIVDDLVTVGDEHLLDGLLHRHTVGIGSDYNPHDILLERYAGA